MRTINRLASRLLPLIVIVTVAAHASAREDAAWKTVEEHYMVLELGGARAGWGRELVESDGQRFRTTTEQNMRVGRGDKAVEAKIISTFIETSSGTPVSATLVQEMSLQPVKITWNFKDDHVEVISNQAGREIKSRQPAPQGEWLTPYAADQFIKRKRTGGDADLTLKTVDLQHGLRVFTVESKKTGETKITFAGETLDVATWNTAMEILPNISAKEYVRKDGVTVVEEIDMPMVGKMITRLATKEEALGAAAGPAPELLLQTFITPDKPIENPMKATRAKLKLTVKNGAMPELPTAGAQRVELSPDKKSAILTIDINDNVPASAADAENKEYLESSAMIDANDELIQKLAKRAADREEGQPGATDDAMRRAEALRRFVRRHISKKGMETAFASASETAKMRTGDCSEYGVLLAALLRADGIPARVATGLVYADAFAGHKSIFGWHMWTQALIGGKWMDFDATLPVRYNAAHILTATSSLNDGMGMGDMASVIQLMGNLEVEVLEVEHGE